MKVIFCLPGRQYSNKFLVSWDNLTKSFAGKDIEYQLINRYSSVVYYARNLCLGGNNLKGENQKPWQGQIDYDYIMWIDSDIIFNPNDFYRLLSISETYKNDVNILSGLYLMEGGQQFATVVEWDIDHFKKYGSFSFMTKNEKDKYNKKELLSVSYTGFGFMLIRKGVFEKIGYPWFRPLWEEVDLLNGIIAKDFTSEDVGFCKMAQKKGFNIFVDLNIVVNHEKTILL